MIHILFSKKINKHAWACFMLPQKALEKHS